MPSRRYTLVIADRSSGVVRRLTVSLRVVSVVGFAVVVMPLLIGLGAKWSSDWQLRHLQTTADELQSENGNYRETTGELTTQIQSLEQVINELGTRSTLDPAQARAMQKLPAVVKARAAGGSANATAPTGSSASTAFSNVLSTSFVSPEDTFGVLRTLLQGLESRLRNVREDVERQEALAAATPSIWPTKGWLTGTFGGRSDPFTGEPGYHQGLDISSEKGQPVQVTADGRVESAQYSGDYGNLVVVKHDFGLTTRYGHLSGFKVKPGDIVKRGDVIGLVGATGRATGSHLHYEILVNDRLINPLQLLTQPARR
jgi:murein DD-endopeptidase MepM/ murein hydrolase activator NlpD